MVLICALSLTSGTLRAISNLTNNDPYPVYTSAYSHEYLTTNLRNAYKGGEDLGQERIQFSVSPFRQAAVVGRDINKQKVPLGDLTGRQNFVGLFYAEDCLPNQNTDIQDKLFTALDCANQLQPGQMKSLLYPPPSSANSHDGAPCGAVIDPAYSDPNNQFGFFSVDETYRKYGVRFQADINLYCNFGLRLQTGFVDIRQIPVFNDQTCQATGISCPVPDPVPSQGYTFTTPDPQGFLTQGGSVNRVHPK
jgi:hypothetical protein